MSAMRRILVAVADSPSGMAAVRTAIETASALHADLRAVHVMVDGELTAVLAAAGREGDIARRRETAAISVLRHVADLAHGAGVPVTTAECVGDIARCVLREAQQWSADAIVVGRTARHGAGDPFAGPEVQQILEFSDRPVLVVPA